MSIIGAEDEDFENDLDPAVDNCRIFSNIEVLKDRPTHLLVFLHHVILQFDCSPLLCYLHADLLKHLNAKETKKHFVEFYNSFLDKGAILRVSVPQNVSTELDRTRPDLLTEEQQRRVALDVQFIQAPLVLQQLEDFRQKRMMGMTPNEAELIEVENHHHTDRIPKEMKEKAVAEGLLDKISDIQPSIVTDEEKCSSIFTAVAYYMKHLGVKTRQDVKKSRDFFRRPLWKGKKSEDSTKSKQKGGLTNILSGGWIAVSTEVKPKTETEVERSKVGQERKTSSIPALPRGSVLDHTAPLFPNRKTGSTGSASLPGSEVSEGAGINISVTSSPDSTHVDAGLPISRSDPLLDGGEVSPVGPPGGGLELWEAPSSSSLNTSAEEFQEKDSIDSPILFPEGSAAGSPLISPAPQQEEVEPRFLELEQDPTNWRELADPEALAHLSKKETKRQEVINELFATEHAHVRMLSVLQMVFSKPLEREEILSTMELATIFPSLDEIIEMHFAFMENLKKLRQDEGFIVKSIGATLISRFGGTEGEWFQKLTARFCSHQSWALDLIKSRQKKEPRFNAFIQEAESKPQCRRLQLKDIIPIEMQRLTKYPLLLENIAKSTENQKEKDSILQSAECCRRILNHVNEEVKVMENLLTLKDYQRRLDTSGLKPSNDLYAEYKNIDLTHRKMIYEGSLVWRVTKEKTLDVQCVLLGDLLVLLQKQDDKMVLKCQSKSNIAVQEGKQMLSPIIKLDSVFLREVATDHKAFYVIFTWDSGAQIYELVAQTIGERKNWTDAIKATVEELKKMSGNPVARLSLIPGIASASPYSPTTLPPQSPTENGGEPLKSLRERDKDDLNDLESRDPRHSLIDYLSDKGFDLIGHTNNVQENVANSALDNVKSLKRLLVGSISLSEDSQPEEENGGEASERQDHTPEGGQPAEEGPSVGELGEYRRQEEEDREERGFSAPLVLSPERLEEVCKKLTSLEDKVKRLQEVEEHHHRLQEALSKFSLQGGNFQ